MLHDVAPTTKPLEAALAYAAQGWRVFPLHTVRDGRCSCGRPDCIGGNRGKHPRVKDWPKQATSDAEGVRTWWRQWPDANVGIATGQRSSLVVLDIDPRHEGMESLAALLQQHGEMPTTLMALTGGGGFHFLFAHPGGDVVVNNRTNVLTGLDVRGDGGYIVVAPSTHYSGNVYAWDNPGTPLAPLPPWLLALLLTPQAPAAPLPPARPLSVDARSRAELADFWTRRYVGEAREGARNDTAAKLAAQLRDTAQLSEEEAEPYLVQYAESVPGGDFTVREALRTLHSIYHRPPREPARGRSTAPGYDPAYAYVMGPTMTPTRAPAFDALARPAADVRAGTAGATAGAGAGTKAGRDEGPDLSDIPWPEPDGDDRTEDRTTGRTGGTTSAALPPAAASPAASQQAPTPLHPSRFTFLTLADLRCLPKPTWLIGGTLVANSLSVVYGEYGSGKSFLTLDWGLCIAAGVAWCGKPVQQGRVVYIAAEGLWGIGKRVTAWQQAHGRGDDVPFHVVGSAPQLLRPEDIEDFARAVRGLPDAPALIVLDTLSRSLVSGDENSQKDMGVAVAAADRLRTEFGCHVLVVHHKPNASPGNGGNGRTRGSSVLPGAADTLIDVTLDGSCVTVACAKQKDAPKFPRLYLDLVSRALDAEGQETSCVLVPRAAGSGGSASVPSGPEGLSVHDARRREIVLGALEAAAGGLRESAWEAAAKLPPTTFHYHRRILAELGLVRKVGEFWMLAKVVPDE